MFGPSGTLVLLVFLAVAIGTWLGSHFKLWEKEGWKNLGTLSVVLGLIGLLGIFMDSSRRFSALEFDVGRKMYGSDGEIAKTAVQFKREYFCNTEFVKGELSPPDFDVTVSDQKKLCEWFKQAELIIFDHEFGKLEPLPSTVLDSPSLEGNGWDREVAGFKKDIQDQNIWTEKLLSLSEAVEVRGWDYFYYWFAPFGLAAALGIQLSKSRYA